MNESPARDESQTIPETPPADYNGPVAPLITEAEFRRKNRRRIDLIDKKYREGLSSAEAAEYAVLDREVAEYINQKYPLPSAHMRQLDEIEERLRNAVPPG